MEHIVTFLPGQFPDSGLWGIEAAGITYPDSRYHIERENSRIICLEYIIQGKGQLNVNGKAFSPGQGDVYLLPMGASHYYRSDSRDPWEKIWMNVYGSLAGQLAESYRLNDRVLFENCAVYPLFREFLTVCENCGSDRNRLAERTTLLFHSILLRLAASRDEGQSGKKLHEPAARVKEYVDQHIYDRLTVADLARVVNLSPSQMTRVFRAAYQVTPYEYILARKTDTACLLLDNSGLSVKEIAYRLNFADEHYFSNVFRKRMGMAPGERRKEAQRQG